MQKAHAFGFDTNLWGRRERSTQCGDYGEDERVLSANDFVLTARMIYVQTNLELCDDCLKILTASPESPYSRVDDDGRRY